ncbi:hypothetical protein CTAYLR_005718 [Chrysophaeum taylorii]|uniref:PH domain-containing protein n=1 Tax=Chrysophaeum taylorii TaxID=2483200 RepID=A0AAD7XRY8_9STRA|nr:hypothetical protein CTAYLR_005718 [Chrysophaeum taylorii]
MLSSPWIHLRALFSDEGSDCLRSGGGKVPYFNSCVGCSIGSAQQCVLDMRRNVSFNVPPDCTLGKLGASVGNPGKNDDQTCCAVEGKRETYAYPDAFSLKKECDTLCPTWKSIWEDACDPSSFDGWMDVAARFVKKVLLLLGSRDLSEQSAKQEYVTKCGHLWRVDSNGKWVKRWFELRKDVLASYKAEDRTKLKNAIKVSKITRIELSTDAERPTHFVMTCGTSSYPFRGETPEDAASWVDTIGKRLHVR